MTDLNSNCYLGQNDKSGRVIALDALRGFSVLGILLMNIQAYSMITAAYVNPTAYGNLEGVNLLAWAFSHIFADQKFMTIFSMLFGASICLLADKYKSNFKKIFARRIFFLLLFGLIHAYLIWYGDVLVTYALCGYVIFLLRNKSPLTLTIISFIFLCIPFIFSLFFGFIVVPQMDMATRLEFVNSWNPEQVKIIEEVMTYQSSWFAQLERRVTDAVFLQSYFFLTLFFWRAASAMLLGVAFYKWGILQGNLSKQFYQKLAIIAGSLGFLLVAIGLYQNFSHNWSMEFSMFIGNQFNYWGSIGVAICYVSLIVLLVKSQFLKYLGNIIAAGRMSLSIYIGHSVVCTFLFYGHGLGYFGKIQRYEQFLLVLIIWIIETYAAFLWLKFFKFGPLEWLWRSAVYWNFQSIRKYETRYET